MNEPTEDADEQVKAKFYPRLQDGVRNSHDMIIVTGDMNAKVEYIKTGIMRVMGKHSLGLSMQR